MVTLTRLGRSDVAALARAVLGSSATLDRVDALFDESEGLPLYVVEALASPGAERGRDAGRGAGAPPRSGRRRGRDRAAGPGRGRGHRPFVRPRTRPCGQRAERGGDGRRARGARPTRARPGGRDRGARRPAARLHPRSPARRRVREPRAWPGDGSSTRRVGDGAGRVRRGGPRGRRSLVADRLSRDTRRTDGGRRGGPSPCRRRGPDGLRERARRASISRRRSPSVTRRPPSSTPRSVRSSRCSGDYDGCALPPRVCRGARRTGRASASSSTARACVHARRGDWDRAEGHLATALSATDGPRVALADPRRPQRHRRPVRRRR